jgi:hypothetical protein
MISWRRVENWQDMIGDHTFGDTMLGRLVYYSHWLTLTGGLSHHRRPPLPPRNPRACPGDRHHPKRLTDNYPFGSHLRCLIMGRQASAQLVSRCGTTGCGTGNPGVPP